MRLLADDLDGELVAGQFKDAGLDASVAALAQHLTLQVVRFLETGGRKSGNEMRQKMIKPDKVNQFSLFLEIF